MTFHPHEKILSRVDYEDSFSHVMSEHLQMRECLHRMYHNTPWWIRDLLQLRNWLVGFLGLKVEEGSVFDVQALKAGESWGFIKILELNNQEAVFRGNDRHLDFIVDFKLEKQVLVCKTQVQYHNFLGKIYFAGVRPFHSKIVPALLKATSGGLK